MSSPVILPWGATHLHTTWGLRIARCTIFSKAPRFVVEVVIINASCPGVISDAILLILTPCWNHKHGNARHGGFSCNLTYKNNRISNPESLRTWYPLVARNSCNLPETHAGTGLRNHTRWSPQGIIWLFSNTLSESNKGTVAGPARWRGWTDRPVLDRHYFQSHLSVKMPLPTTSIFQTTCYKLP